MKRGAYVYIQGLLAFLVSYSTRLLIVLYFVETARSPLFIGIIISLIGLVAATAAIPLGLLCDRYERRLLIFLGLALVSSSLLLMITLDMLVVPISLMIFGLGWAAYEPAIDAFMRDITPPEKIGRAFGLLAAVLNAGVALGPVVAGTLFDLVGIRQALVMNFVLSMVCVLFTFLLPKTFHASPRVRSVYKFSRHDIRRGVVAGWGGTVLAFGVFASIDTFFPVYAKSLGIGGALIGAVLSAKGVISMLTRIPLGLVADKEWLRIKILASGLALSSSAWAFVALEGRVEIFFVLIAVTGLGIAMSNTGSITLIASEAPEHKRGFFFGITTTCRQAGLMLGPILTGFLVSVDGLKFGIIGTSLVMIIATVALYGGFKLVGRST